MPVEPRTIVSLSRALRTRELTSEAVTRSCLERIIERNAGLNAYISVFAHAAIEQARDADREITAGRYRGPLHGVPISLKDLLDVRGVATTAASRVREHHVASRDAVVVEHLRVGGAVLIGKCNLHEFAFGTTNEDSAFGPARHPLDPSRSPGGSSGGSAVSVAAEMAYASIGTDTGGSVRIPAAMCGLVGLKPAPGEISTVGVVPLSRTMDHVGPLCRSVDDAALLYEVLRGETPTTLPPADPVKGLRFGVLRNYFLALLDAQVAAAFESACARLQGQGAALDDATIAHANDIAPVYLHIVLAEAGAYHAKTLESRADQYTKNVRLRLEMGRYVLAEDYARALRGRELLRQAVDEALESRDALILPTVAVPATKLGAETVRVGSSDEPVRSITLRLTQLFNLTGHPALTIPCGKTSEGLPIGLQVVGHAHGTRALLSVARRLEGHLGPGGSR